MPAVQVIVAKLKETDPVVAASVSKIELMVSPSAACDSRRCAPYVQRSLQPLVEHSTNRAAPLHVSLVCKNASRHVAAWFITTGHASSWYDNLTLCYGCTMARHACYAAVPEADARMWLCSAWP